jgi:hypothetical protein
MVDGVGTTAYSYNEVGQLLSEAGPWLGDTVNYSVSVTPSTSGEEVIATVA